MPGPPPTVPRAAAPHNPRQISFSQRGQGEGEVLTSALGRRGSAGPAVPEQ